MMIIFAFKKGELKEKTQEANFSLPIKNPNPLLKTASGFGFQNLGGARIRIRIANPNLNKIKMLKLGCWTQSNGGFLHSTNFGIFCKIALSLLLQSSKLKMIFLKVLNEKYILHKKMINSTMNVLILRNKIKHQI